MNTKTHFFEEHVKCPFLDTRNIWSSVDGLGMTHLVSPLKDFAPKMAVSNEGDITIDLYLI